MKKISIFAAMLAMAASCTVSEVDTIKEEITAPEIIASYENNGTKTTLITDEEGVGTIWWKPADEINVFYGTTSTHYVSKNKENATTVTFETTDVIGTTEDSEQENIWGLYPYDENAVCDGESVTATIPAIQKAVAGTFDDDLFTSLAHSTSTVMTFYNVLGGIKFSLSRNDIKKITFKGNNDEDIAGKVKLEMDANDKPVAEITEGEKTITLTPKEGTTFASNTNYYIVLLPTVLSNGFTMTFETETEIGTFEYSEKSIEIKRSVFSKKENIDSYAEFVAKDRLLPFTITSNGSTSVSISRVGSDPSLTNISLEYAKGSDSWASYSLGTAIDLADGESLKFRAGEGGNLYFSKYEDNYYKVVVDGEGVVKASGNIMSLLDRMMERSFVLDYSFTHLFNHCNKLVDASELKLPATTLAPGCYCYMFNGCTSLTTAPDLPATNLARRCYAYMFNVCTSLTTAPTKLPATTLAEGCYYMMFADCKSLATAPELPATTLARECYYGLFWNCQSLTSAPTILPATTLVHSCYYKMFSYCKSLAIAPKLLATNLATDCCKEMFKGCTALVTAPELLATTLGDCCYQDMFNGCTSMTTAPTILPATTLVFCCYYKMFLGCTALVTAPKLPATNLGGYCYQDMFNGCTSLMTAPDLPATNLATGCYQDMFDGCTSLTTAPDLPATNLATGCYIGMFFGCSKLNYVKALFTTEPSEKYTEYWLLAVSSKGTFVKSKDATWDVTGYNGIPKGWAVQIAE